MRSAHRVGVLPDSRTIHPVARRDALRALDTFPPLTLQLGERRTTVTGLVADGASAGDLDQRSACPGTLGWRTIHDETASGQDMEQRCRPGNGVLSSLTASGEGSGVSRLCCPPVVRAPRGRVVNGVGGWVGRASRSRGRRGSADGRLIVSRRCQRSYPWSLSRGCALAPVPGTVGCDRRRSTSSSRLILSMLDRLAESRIVRSLPALMAVRMAARTWGAVTGPLLFRCVATPDATSALSALGTGQVTGSRGPAQRRFDELAGKVNTLGATTPGQRTRAAPLERLTPARARGETGDHETRYGLFPIDSEGGRILVHHARAEGRLPRQSSPVAQRVRSGAQCGSNVAAAPQ